MKTSLSRMLPAMVMLYAVLWVAAFGMVAAQESPGKATSSVVTKPREIHVSPQGDNKNDGSAANPIATLEAAQTLARTVRGTTVVIHGGTYRLERRLEFTHEDEGVEFRAAAGEKVIITSDRKLELNWQPFHDGIWQADLGLQIYSHPNLSPNARPQTKLQVDELFVNGQRQRMARYPNFDPEIRPFGGFAADAVSRERAARWSNPAGGYLHALHPGAWGGVHLVITGKDQNGEVLTDGGRQNNRGSGMHKQHRYVENIFEELDAAGEWFYDQMSSILYFMPPGGLDLANAKIEFPTESQLIRMDGTQKQPVKHVTLRGLTFCHANRTFMQTKEPLLRSDWTIDREGAVLMEGTEDCSLIDCEFDQIGGNAIFVSKYNRRVYITGCDIHETGASAVAFVGDPLAVRNPLFEYGQRQSLDKINQEPGPQTEGYPADCLVEDCLIRGIGLVEKQAAGVQIAMSTGITVRHCSIYDASRAGINIGDGCWGGHLIEHCDVFDTVQETGDYRVKEDSPALKLGFKNFSMDDFGVQKPELKKVARTPKLPGNEPPPQPIGQRSKQAVEHIWRGAILRNISGDEFSAFGVTKDAGGVHLKSVPNDSEAATDGFKSNDLIHSINDQPVKTVADLLRLQNAAAGKRLEFRFTRAQTANQIAVDHYLFATTEFADAGGFKTIPLAATKDLLPITALTTQPATNNEPLQTLFDGKLDRNYGPVFSNGVEGGLYKVELGQRRDIKSINTWSFHQNGNRGPQHFSLYGSAKETDPGWNTNDRKFFTPLIEVDSTAFPAEPFQATSIQSSADRTIGPYRWLVWQVHSITPIGENTSFQEVQVIAP